MNKIFKLRHSVQDWGEAQNPRHGVQHKKDKMPKAFLHYVL